MTAIAAVLALSSTPLAAQEATSTDVPLVTVPVSEPVVPATDPLAPAPEAEVSAPAETTAAPETAEVSEPAEAAPIAKKAAATKAEPRVTRTAAAPVATPAAEAPEPAAAPIVAARPTAEPAPVEQAEAEPRIDEAIPLAGGAGAVILALAGAGMAIRRRKRSEEEEGESQDEMVLTDEVTPVPAPEPWNSPVVEPGVAPAGARTDASEDFDTSRFGRHVQAAYRGPTPDNPSMSLRKRLKLAGELDRRERISGTMPKAAAPATAQPTGFMLGGTATQAKAREYQF